MYYIAIFLGVTLLVPWSHQHGRLITPPGRSTAWRYGFNTPVNQNDNELNCGGFANQWVNNDGMCGECGDPYEQAIGTRPNQAGGTYATGTIVATYSPGQLIDISLNITANHKGWNEFRLCAVNDKDTAATQECFDQNLLQLENGATRHYFQEPYVTGTYTITVRLPAGLTCSQCVLQWRWHCGNSWGTDPDGTSCTGCGPQENFMGCADITIIGDSGNTSPESTGDTTTSGTTTTTTDAPTTTASTTTGPVGGDCVWIGDTGGSDEWCNTNCNYVPPNCPPDLCQCEGSF